MMSNRHWLRGRKEKEERRKKKLMRGFHMGSRWFEGLSLEDLLDEKKFNPLFIFEFFWIRERFLTFRTGGLQEILQPVHFD